MKILILSSILLNNLVFAAVCGWMEGVMDDKYYSKERIAGLKKHPTYTILRGCFWFIACTEIALLWSGWELAFTEGAMVVIMLFQFRFVHDGCYHITRNRLNERVSPEKFYQDEDGLSKSFWDVILGHTYKARLGWFILTLFAFGILLGCLHYKLF